MKTTEEKVEKITQALVLLTNGLEALTTTIYEMDAKLAECVPSWTPARPRGMRDKKGAQL